MTDRVPGAPGRYTATITASDLQKLQAGETFNITLTRNDAPITEGTPYSKAAVLPDALASVLCPDVTDPSPADAFSALLDLLNAIGADGSSVIGIEHGGTGKATAAEARSALGAAPSAHNHDDRYYTETETDTKLAGKANSSHTHSKDQVGLGNVDNTADANKTVLEANRLKVRTTSSLVVTDGNGLYYYPANAQDLPPNNQDGLLLFITYGAWGAQLAFPTGGGVYYRYGTTTFSAWKRLDS